MGKYSIIFVFAVACLLIPCQASDFNKVFGKWIEQGVSKKAKMIVSPSDYSDPDHGLLKMTYGHKVSSATYEVYNSDLDDKGTYTFWLHIRDDGQKVDQMWVFAEGDKGAMLGIKKAGDSNANDVVLWLRSGH